jgi:hypothetical protein
MIAIYDMFGVLNIAVIERLWTTVTLLADKTFFCEQVLPFAHAELNMC